jgi:hypothetical protein
MKTMFFAAVLVLGVAVIGGAQTAPADVAIRASAITRDADVWHLNGNVEITMGTVRVIADAADFPSGPSGIELRGNVHLTTGSGRQRVEFRLTDGSTVSR